MSGSSGTPSDRAKGSPRKQQTRQRLVAAAIALLHEEGPDALTTVRITKGAGIAQSSFYEHFRNVDECLRAVATVVDQEINQRISELRRGAYAQLTSAEEFFNRDALKRVHAESFDVLNLRPELAHIMTRYRYDTSVLGHAIRAGIDRAIQGSVEDVAATLERLNVPLPRDEIALLLRLVYGLVFAAAEAIQEGKLTDRERIIRRSATAVRAMFRAAIMEVSGGSAPEATSR